MSIINKHATHWDQFFWHPYLYISILTLIRLIAELAESDSDEEDEEEKDVTDMETKFGTDSLLTDKDKLKRKDNSRLRTPFECQGTSNGI